MIDSHCHLADEAFAGDLDDVVRRAQDSGLLAALCILSAGDDKEAAAASVVRAKWDAVRFSVGIHPHNAGQFEGRLGEIGGLLRRSVADWSAVGIGEIGLDYHYDFSPRDVQQAVFRAQLQLARDLALPVVIHTREAEDDTLSILAEESLRGLRGVFHCFTGDHAAAARALATGFYVSIPGIVTFPKAEDLRIAACAVPNDRILIETDSPYLAPLPHRGKRNEPAFVASVFESLAALRGVERPAFATQLIENFDDLFCAPAR